MHLFIERDSNDGMTGIFSYLSSYNVDNSIHPTLLLTFRRRTSGDNPQTRCNSSEVPFPVAPTKTKPPVHFTLRARAVDERFFSFWGELHSERSAARPSTSLCSAQDACGVQSKNAVYICPRFEMHASMSAYIQTVCCLRATIAINSPRGSPASLPNAA